MDRDKNGQKIFDHYEVNTSNEQVIISSLIKSKECRKRFFSKLKVKYFIGKRHKNIFLVVKEMDEKDLSYNEDTFMQLAGEREIGGLDYLRKVIEAYDTNANLEFHIEQLITDRLKFDLFRGAGIELINMLCTKNTTRKDLLKLSTKIHDVISEKTVVEQIQSGKELGKEYIEDFNKRMNREFVGTGLKELDDKLTEGFVPGTISVLSGRPSMGKTILMINIISYLQSRKKLLICEIEMGSLLIVDMLVSLHTGISLEKLIKKTGELSAKQRKRTKHKVRLLLENPNLSFLDDPDLSLDRLEVELKNNHYDICFIDLFGRLTDVIPTAEGFTRKLYQVKRMARNIGTHICLVHQIRRSKGKEKNKRPTLERLKDSGSWEEVGDLILGLHREKYYKSELRKDIAEILILKQKRGVSGVIIPFAFDPSVSEFGEHVSDYIFGRDISSF